MTAPFGHRILVEFLDFAVGDGDFLYLDDFYYSGVSVPDDFRSSTSSMTITFTSDDVDNYPGFLLRMSAVSVLGTVKIKERFILSAPCWWQSITHQYLNLYQCIE